MNNLITITINLTDKQLVLTLEEAQELKNKLQLFRPKNTIRARGSKL